MIFLRSERLGPSGALSMPLRLANFSIEQPQGNNGAMPLQAAGKKDSKVVLPFLQARLQENRSSLTIDWPTLIWILLTASHFAAFAAGCLWLFSENLSAFVSAVLCLFFSKINHAHPKSPVLMTVALAATWRAY